MEIWLTICKLSVSRGASARRALMPARLHLTAARHLHPCPHIPSCARTRPAGSVSWLRRPWASARRRRRAGSCRSSATRSRPGPVSASPSCPQPCRRRPGHLVEVVDPVGEVLRGGERHQAGQQRVERALQVIEVELLHLRAALAQCCDEARRSKLTVSAWNLALASSRSRSTMVINSSSSTATTMFISTCARAAQHAESRVDADVPARRGACRRQRRSRPAVQSGGGRPQPLPTPKS
eukprot:760956-Hanusia_phi.AAC.1